MRHDIFLRVNLETKETNIHIYIVSSAESANSQIVLLICLDSSHLKE